MPWRLQSEPSTKERIIAGVSYLTCGIAGLIYTLMTGNGRQSQLFRFHFIQSILLWIIASLASFGAQPLITLLVGGVALISPAAAIAAGQGIGILLTILTNAFWLLLLYGAFFAFRGKFAEVPLISNVVRQNMGA